MAKMLAASFAEELRVATDAAQKHFNKNLEVWFVQKPCAAQWEDYNLMAVKCKRQFEEQVKAMIADVQVTSRAGKRIIQENFKTFDREDEEPILISWEFKVNLAALNCISTTGDEKTSALRFLASKLDTIGLERSSDWDFVSYCPRKTNNDHFRFVLKADDAMQIKIQDDFRTKLSETIDAIVRPWIWRVGTSLIYVAPVHLSATGRKRNGANMPAMPPGAKSGATNGATGAGPSETTVEQPANVEQPEAVEQLVSEEEHSIEDEEDYGQLYHLLSLNDDDDERLINGNDFIDDEEEQELDES